MTKTNLSNFQIELQKTTLQNGLKFVHFKKLNAPIAISVISRSGARFDPKGKEGLAHFLEHMLFTSTQKYPSKKDISMILEDSGSFYSASTGTEATNIQFTIAKKENLNIVSDILDQIINKPLFLDKSIESEKNIIATEIDTKLSTYKRVLTNNIKSILFGDDPIANNFSGTKQAVKTITADDLKYQLTEIFPQNLTVVSCGDCDIQDLTERLSPILPCKPLANFKHAQVKEQKTRHGITKTEGNIAHCKFVFPTCGIDSNDRLALRILSTALGKGRSSLLKETLRYDSGLLYTVNSSNTYFEDTGYLQIDFSLRNENLIVTLDKTISTFLQLSNNGISEETLTTIKNKLINSSTISMQTVGDWVDFHFYRELLVRDNNYYYNDFLNEVNKITKEQIDKVASKYLRYDNTYFWVIGNTSKEELSKIFT